MCGLAGFLTTAIDRTALAPTARAMATALLHRGPDDSGVWTDEDAGFALGFRRLSIIDLSPAGHQPMVSDNGRYVIAFNGEIYNFAEMRADLEARHEAPQWRGHSDTEVLLATIQACGLMQALRQSVGMFAFALWDKHERTLHLARDRIGEKPMYYGRSGTTFLFGSELKALRAFPSWNPTIDRGSIALLMRHNYIPAPHSIYAGISKLQPGSVATLRWGASVPTIEPYWSARAMAVNGIENPITDAEPVIVDELESRLRTAVRRQMVADVPLGAFLSGGIDSSAIVALMQAQSTRPVRTFTIGFHEAAYDEAPYAKAVAQHLGTDHTELTVTPREAMDVIPRLPSIYDEPFSDSSQIPTFLVSQLARKHVTVSLSGDGGDELFAGYNRYNLGRRLWSYLSWLPDSARRPLASLLKSIRPDHWNLIASPALLLTARQPKGALFGDRVHKLADTLQHGTVDKFYRELVTHWSNPCAVVVTEREPNTVLDENSSAGISNPVAQMMLLDLISYLPDDILVKVDRASMAVSLESRVPMLDHQVVELAWRIPLSLKVGSLGSKHVLRKILHRYVPQSMVDRPKTGFGIPIDEWLRGPLKPWAESLLDPARLKREGFFRPELIVRRWREHASGRRNWHYSLWDVLMFQAWLEHSHGR